MDIIEITRLHIIYFLTLVVTTLHNLFNTALFKSYSMANAHTINYFKRQEIDKFSFSCLVTSYRN